MFCARRVPPRDTPHNDVSSELSGQSEPSNPTADHPSDISGTEVCVCPEQCSNCDVEPLALEVSISRAQTHLADPKTPAVEKRAALVDGGDYFAAFDDVLESSEIVEDLQLKGHGSGREERGYAPLIGKHSSAVLQTDGSSTSTHRSKAASQSSIALPSPWIAGPKNFYFDDQKPSHRALLANATEARQRSASDPSRLQLPFGLPSLPNPATYLQTLLGDQVLDEEKTGDESRHQRAKRSSGTITAWNGFSWDSFAARHLTLKDRTLSSTFSKSTSTQSPRRSAPRRSHEGKSGELEASTLRRSRSEDSFQLRRALSIASSLGDDTRFADVSEQINNRMKAIRDTIQDSNLKLPRPSLLAMPKSSALSARLARFGDNDKTIRDKLRSGDISSAGSESRASSSTVRITGAANTRRDSRNDTATAENALHPHLARALSNLEGDIVVLGGYRGSILRETEAPYKRCWIPMKAGLGLGKVDLEVGLTDEDEENMPQTIYASGMMTHIGPVDISRRLLKKLRSCENALAGRLRVHEYAYDWRLSPHRLTRQLLDFVAKLSCNRPDAPSKTRGALMIAHSLGGLLTCHAVNQRPELFTGVLYAGTPFHRCINILGPIRNGDDVLLSSKVLTAQVNFTIRTSFALLPLDGFAFIDKDTKEEYPVDFFDVEHWIENRWSPVISPPLPALQVRKTGLGSMLATATSSLPNLPNLPGGFSAAISDLSFNLRRNSDKENGPSGDIGEKADTEFKKVAAAVKGSGGSTATTVAPQMGGLPSITASSDKEQGPAINANITIPRGVALEYLTRTLAEVKHFKQELAYEPQRAYPPLAVMYGKSTPTVYAARISGREGMKRADAYDNLAFASGDGVVLARAAMLPEGYHAVKRGVIASERGHISLLADLEGVGRALEAILRARDRR